MADVRSRQGWFSTLQRLEVTVNAIDPNMITHGELKAHLENAERIWKKLDDAHAKVLLTAADDAAFLFQQDTLEPMSTCLFSIKSKIYTLQAARSTHTSHSTNLKLPEISLPKFDGKFDEWTTFQDLFLATVDRNNSLSGSQKLQYLKSYTSGEAASLIKSFIISDANYKEAWQLLEQQYDNKRAIIHSLVSKLLNQQTIKSEAASSLQEMLNVTLECVRSLKVLGRPTDQWDDLIVVALIDKFDSSTRAEWARSLKGTDPPTFVELQDFIMQQIQTLHAKGLVKPITNKAQSSHQHQQTSKKVNSNHVSVPLCLFCKESHHLYHCQKLKDMTSDKRFAAVKATKACLNCLREGHSSKECPSQSTCKKCNKKHNTFLHNERNTIPQINVNHTTTNSASTQDSKEPLSVAINTTAMTNRCSTTILKTALVDVYDASNVKHQLRVCLDDGGEGSLICEKYIHCLGMKKQRVNATVSGVGGKEAMKSKYRCSIRLHSRINNSFVDVDLYGVPRVTGDINTLPRSSKFSWSHLSGIELADPDFNNGKPIDILLGADVVPYVLKEGIKRADLSSPVAQNTIFGWVLFGNASTATSTSSSSSQQFKVNNFKCEISKTLQRFWEIEEVLSQLPLTKEEESCEQHFQNTHERLKDGRYMVRLPFNENKDKLSDNMDQAYRRLLCLEKRFKRHPQYKSAYIDFMREYESLNHMKKITSSTSKPSNAFYLPHHFVLKEDSTTTKQRTVFDGSAKSSSGFSLNDTLLVGATIQPSLYTLLLKFRLNKIAIKADINKMYRQFLVHPDDQGYQMILWRENADEQVKHYKLTTVTYGTGCAPFLATRCLNQLAYDERNRYPAAADSILNQFYVDDLIGSVDSKESAISLVNELIQVMSSARMEIRKWASNDSDVLQSIPEHLREDSCFSAFEDDSNTIVKALGVKWHPTTDCFQFAVNINTTEIPTKRFLLSEISKTFDPLGWLSPVTIVAKLLLQKVWISGNNWDEEVTCALQEEWRHYQQTLSELENVRIPRCAVQEKPIKAELHGYCDSSELAFCSTVYLKCYYVDTTTSITLLTSRTKVAPIKCISLPKLELCGASLLAETISTVSKAISFNHDIYCWTDSTITLH